MVCLSALLFGARSVPGKQWIGKYRKVLKMTATRKKNQKEREAKISEVRQCFVCTCSMMDHVHSGSTIE